MFGILRKFGQMHVLYIVKALLGQFDNWKQFAKLFQKLGIMQTCQLTNLTNENNIIRFHLHCLTSNIKLRKNGHNLPS